MIPVSCTMSRTSVHSSNFQSYKFWQLYGGVNGDLLQKGLCHTQVCCTQNMSLRQTITHPYLPRKCSNTLLSQLLWGPWVLGLTRFIWALWVSLVEWGLILNMNSPLLPSCWGFLCHFPIPKPITTWRKWKELKSFLMKVKEEGGKVGLKLKIQKTKIMASGPITRWGTRWGNSGWLYFRGAPKSLQMVIAAMKLKDA